MGDHRQGRAWSRKYPPLSGAVLSVVLMALVFPSALNVPQSNPTETLQFAPVPPEDDVPPPPPAGNVSSLSLGTSATSPGDQAGGTGPGLPPPIPPDGLGLRPITKRCVGDPPRQTEDPLSPPCVAHFEGDNFGATHRGVTTDEVVVLFYLDGSRCEGATSRGFECPEKGVVIDLDDPPEEADHSSTRFLRTYLQYFNDRFQAYGRRVHGYVYNDTGSTEAPATPESRRADTTQLIEDLAPFAILPYAIAYNDDVVVQAASEEVLVFGSFGARESTFYAAYPGLIWGYPATLEKQALTFTSFVCTKVLPYPVSFSGNPGDQGQPRKLGLLRTTDPAKVSFARYGEISEQQLRECGADLLVGTYPRSGTIADPENQTPAVQNMSTFASQGVTTVLHSQGFDTWHTRSAATLDYRPEWVYAGDYQTEGYQPMGFQDQEVADRHSWVVTGMPLARATSQTMCYRSLRETDPQMPTFDINWVCGSRTYYEDLRLLFTGLQTAGPRLTPESIDKGLHAIPPVRSRDPAVPACFFDPGDYTCVKDAAAAWYDADAPRGVQGTERGCWRMAQGGERYFAASWPEGDVLNMQADSDPCNAFQGSANK